MTEEYGLPLRPPDIELVNVGELLGDLAKALYVTTDSFNSGGEIRETMAAFRQLADVTARMASVLAHVQIAVPKEPGSAS